MKKQYFDQKCYDLAVHFLPDSATEERKNEVAAVIQEAIEDELTDEEKFGS